MASELDAGFEKWRRKVSTDDLTRFIANPTHGGAFYKNWLDVYRTNEAAEYVALAKLELKRRDRRASLLEKIAFAVGGALVGAAIKTLLSG